MKKWVAGLLVMAVGASVALANGLGAYGSYWDTKDLGPGVGGGVKFKGDLAEMLGIEVRAAGLTKFDEWEGDDELFVIPIEAGLLLNLPLGEDVPITLYGGGGGGYAIIPEADDVDFDDDFCFYGVGGIELGLGENASLFGEVLYRVLEVGGAEIDDIEVESEEDVEITGVSFNAGLLFRF